MNKGRLLADLFFYLYLMPVVSDMEFICIIKIQWVA